MYMEPIWFYAKGSIWKLYTFLRVYTERIKEKKRDLRMVFIDVQKLIIYDNWSGNMTRSKDETCS